MGKTFEKIVRTAKEKLGIKKDLPDATFEKYLKANERFPQMMEGILIYTLSELVSDPLFSPFNIGTYEFKKKHFDRLLETMNKYHPKAKLTKEQQNNAENNLKTQSTGLLNRIQARLKRYFEYNDSNLNNLRNVLKELKEFIDENSEVEQKRKLFLEMLFKGEKPNREDFEIFLVYKIREKFLRKYNPEITALFSA